MAEKRRMKTQCERSIREKFDETVNGVHACGVRTIRREQHEVEIEISVNYEAIATEMGRRAFHNKTGQCTDGSVTVRVIGSKKTSESTV